MRPAPANLRLSRNKVWFQHTVRWLLALLLAAFGCLIVLKAWTVHKAHKVKQITRSLETLTPGKSSRKDAEQIFTENPARLSAAQ
jgi:predicted negative regulator of RcsB-dependent stress response